MTLERRLQITLHALLLLSTFMLAMGDHDSPWPLAMLGVIPLSFLFNEYLGWMRFFTRPVANWAAVPMPWLNPMVIGVLKPTIVFLKTNWAMSVSRVEAFTRPCRLGGFWLNQPALAGMPA